MDSTFYLNRTFRLLRRGSLPSNVNQSVCSTRHMESFPHTYYVYGITLHSGIPLSLPVRGYGELADIELRTAPAALFSSAIAGVSLEQAAGSWYQICRLANGSSYVRWEGVGEFLISGGDGNNHEFIGEAFFNQHNLFSWSPRRRPPCSVAISASRLAIQVGQPALTSSGLLPFRSEGRSSLSASRIGCASL